VSSPERGPATGAAGLEAEKALRGPDLATPAADVHTSILSMSILPYCLRISLLAVFIASTVAIVLRKFCPATGAAGLEAEKALRGPDLATPAADVQHGAGLPHPVSEGTHMCKTEPASPPCLDRLASCASDRGIWSTGAAGLEAEKALRGPDLATPAADVQHGAGLPHNTAFWG
jgi:hypothetical protein